MSGADYPDWATPQAHASAIASTGVPLLGNASMLLDLAGQAVTAASPYNSAVMPVTQLSYDIEILASTASAATVPFLLVTLNWIDTVTAADMPSDSYIIPAAQGTFSDVAGRGPCKADQVQVNIQYLDPVQTASVACSLIQHSRPLTVDRWSWRNTGMSGLTIPTWRLPTLPADNSCLGVIANEVIAASSTVAFLFGMYNGPVGVGININSGTLANVLVQFAPVPSSAYAQNNPLGAWLNPTPVFQIAGPRSPIRVEINNQGTASVTMSMGLFALSQS